MTTNRYEPWFADRDEEEVISTENRRYSRKELADLLNTLQAKADRLDAAEKKIERERALFVSVSEWDKGYARALELCEWWIKEAK